MTDSNSDHYDKAFSDSELVSAAKNGDAAAFNTLAARYSPTMGRLSRSYFSDSLTREDWLQESMLGFFLAVRAYDLQSEVPFGAYAAVCVKNRLNSVWRRANSKSNAPLNDYILYDDSAVPPSDSLEDSYIENEQYRFFTESFLEQLSETERAIISYYLAGFSYKEIGEKLHINRKSVDNALCRAKSKLKKAFDP